MKKMINQKTSSRNCLGCQYYLGNNKCNIFPWKNDYVKIEDPANFVCQNFRYKQVYCDVCGTPIDPLKLLMVGETCSGKVQLKKLKYQGIETKLDGKYIIHCLKCIPKDYFWGENEEASK